MATPVSWFLIELGWRVESADGEELGRVEDVKGDANADLFDGLDVASTVVARSRYVPSELVGEIVEGTVRLNLDRAAFEHLAGGPERAGPARRALAWLGLTGRR